MGTHADFWQLTAEALDYACERHAITDASLRQQLLETYRELSAYPEVPAMLRAIRGAGFKTAILSNGAPAMLQAALEAADLGPQFDALLSVERRTSSRIRRLSIGSRSPRRDGGRICFVARAMGHLRARIHFRAVWINRRASPRPLPAGPEIELGDLAELPQRVGRS
jgi:2-haloacid dehalogenase